MSQDFSRTWLKAVMDSAQSDYGRGRAEERTALLARLDAPETVEQGAAAWMASEEEQSQEWAENLLRAGSGVPHSGDCTNEAHTCLVCLRNEYLKHMAAALATLRRVLEQEGRAAPSDGGE